MNQRDRKKDRKKDGGGGLQRIRGSFFAFLFFFLNNVTSQLLIINHHIIRKHLYFVDRCEGGREGGGRGEINFFFSKFSFMPNELY